MTLIVSAQGVARMLEMEGMAARHSAQVVQLTEVMVVAIIL